MIVQSKYSPAYIPNVNLADYGLAAASVLAEQPALINGTTGEECSYSDLTGRILAAAGAFYQKGLRKGDVVCIFSKNDINYISAMIGIVKIGGVVTTCTPLSKSDELVRQLEDSQSKYIIASVEGISTVTAAIKQYSGIKEAFIFGPAQEGFESFSTLLSYKGSPAPYVEIDYSKDVAMMPYSSGTTGKPKGIMLTQRNMVAAVQAFLHRGLNGFQRGDVLMFVPPFFHIYGLWFVFCSILQGTTLVFMERFDFKQHFQLIQDYKACFTLIVPPILVQIAKSPLVDEYDLSSLRTFFVGAAPLSKAIEEEITQRLPNAKIQQVYGMTEVCGPSHLVPLNDTPTVHGTVGKLLPNYEAKVVDVETGKELGPNARGELLLRSPQIMTGYFLVDCKAFDSDGFFYTGDIVYFDENDNWFVVDRLKELIKYKAYQVAPAELEDLLLSHPDVGDAAVVGLSDLEAGELPKAFVVVKAGHTTTEADIVTFVAEKVAPHKKLRGGVEFVSAIPKSPSGKILRKLLKEQLQKVET